MMVKVQQCRRCKRFFCDDPLSRREVILSSKSEMKRFIKKHRAQWKRAGHSVEISELLRPSEVPSPWGLLCIECEWQVRLPHLYNGQSKRGIARARVITASHKTGDSSLDDIVRMWEGKN
jgi:hypothetical protein